MFVEIYHILFQYEIIYWVQKEFVSSSRDN